MTGRGDYGWLMKDGNDEVEVMIETSKSMIIAIYQPRSLDQRSNLI